jgi:c(7)-type cytochrome triheme protein
MIFRKKFCKQLVVAVALIFAGCCFGSGFPDSQMPTADIIITLNRMDPVAFSHVRHLAVDSPKKTLKVTGFSCSDCHPVPFERSSKGSIGMEVPHESNGCAQCHNGQKRSDNMPSAFAANTRCLTCHKSPADSAGDIPR